LGYIITITNNKLIRTYEFGILNITKEREAKIETAEIKF
jgi:hypothetical protein